MAKQREPKTGLTPAQKTLVHEVVKGKDHLEAHKIAYPNNKCSDKSRREWACRILKQPKVQKYYNELLEEIKQREVEKANWTREMAIEELKFLLESNKRDIIRIQEAYEEELKMLAKQLKENPKKADKILEKMIAAKKQSRTKVPNTVGMTSAISELNKISGFNEQNINVNGTVIFEDEEDLPD